MAKFFSTAGPIREDKHYFIPVAERIDLEEIFTLIDQEKYFVLHAPRQSGKTTTLLELCKILNKTGSYKCLCINVESAQTARGNVEQAMRIITQDLVRREKIYLPRQLPRPKGRSLLEEILQALMLTRLSKKG